MKKFIFSFMALLFIFQSLQPHAVICPLKALEKAIQECGPIMHDDLSHEQCPFFKACEKYLNPASVDMFYTGQAEIDDSGYTDDELQVSVTKMEREDEQAGNRMMEITSTLNISVEFVKKGNESFVWHQEQQYSGICMEEAFAVYDRDGQAKDARFYQSFFNSQDDFEETPVACLSTKSGDQLFMMICDIPKDEYEVTHRAEQVMQDIVQGDLEKVSYYEKVYFPKIDLEKTSEIVPQLEGICFKVDDIWFWEIKKAFMKTLFKMNEEGAIARQICSFLMELDLLACEIEREYFSLNIDKPFLVWIVRNGKVLFAEYCDVSCWGDPGDIAFGQDGLSPLDDELIDWHLCGLEM